MKIREIIHYLEHFAPLSLQEDYDNSGLLSGVDELDCTGIITTLDCIEEVIQEAIDKKCNLIVAHHPIIFRSIKKLTGKNYVEKAIIKAIKNDIAIYAIHTNLDNVIYGVNGKIARILGLQNQQVFMPRKDQLKKLITFVPPDKADLLRETLFNAGGGNIRKYNECSFNTEGIGTFKPLEGSHPETGEVNKRHIGKELKIELIFPAHMQETLITAMKSAHPYEEVAFDIIQLANFHLDIGSGIIGDMKEEMSEKRFLEKLKQDFKLTLIRHSPFTGKNINKVALCGGAGSFLIPMAILNQADIYITSDLKYHEFFEADNKLLLADIGHYESEQFTIELLYEFLKEKNLNFAVLKSEVNTNPVHYFI